MEDFYAFKDILSADESWSSSFLRPNIVILLVIVIGIAGIITYFLMRNRNKKDVAVKKKKKDGSVAGKTTTKTTVAAPCIQPLPTKCSNEMSAAERKVEVQRIINEIESNVNRTINTQTDDLLQKVMNGQKINDEIVQSQINDVTSRFSQDIAPLIETNIIKNINMKDSDILVELNDKLKDVYKNIISLHLLEDKDKKTSVNSTVINDIVNKTTESIRDNIKTIFNDHDTTITAFQTDVEQLLYDQTTDLSDKIINIRSEAATAIKSEVNVLVKDLSVAIVNLIKSETTNNPDLFKKDIKDNIIKYLNEELSNHLETIVLNHRQSEEKLRRDKADQIKLFIHDVTSDVEESVKKMLKNEIDVEELGKKIKNTIDSSFTELPAHLIEINVKMQDEIDREIKTLSNTIHQNILNTIVEEMKNVKMDDHYNGEMKNKLEDVLKTEIELTVKNYAKKIADSTTNKTNLVSSLQNAVYKDVRDKVIALFGSRADSISSTKEIIDKIINDAFGHSYEKISLSWHEKKEDFKNQVNKIAQEIKNALRDKLLNQFPGNKISNEVLKTIWNELSKSLTDTLTKVENMVEENDKKQETSKEEVITNVKDAVVMKIDETIKDYLASRSETTNQMKEKVKTLLDTELNKIIIKVHLQQKNYEEANIRNMEIHAKQISDNITSYVETGTKKVDTDYSSSIIEYTKNYVPQKITKLLKEYLGKATLDESSKETLSRSFVDAVTKDLSNEIESIFDKRAQKLSSIKDDVKSEVHSSLTKLSKEIDKKANENHKYLEDKIMLYENDLIDDIIKVAKTHVPKELMTRDATNVFLAELKEQLKKEHGEFVLQFTSKLNIIKSLHEMNLNSIFQQTERSLQSGITLVNDQYSKDIVQMNKDIAKNVEGIFKNINVDTDLVSKFEKDLILKSKLNEFRDTVVKILCNDEKKRIPTVIFQKALDTLLKEIKNNYIYSNSLKIPSEEEVNTMINAFAKKIKQNIVLTKEFNDDSKKTLEIFEHSTFVSIDSKKDEYNIVSKLNISKNNFISSYNNVDNEIFWMVYYGLSKYELPKFAIFFNFDHTSIGLENGIKDPQLQVYKMDVKLYVITNCLVSFKNQMFTFDFDNMNILVLLQNYDTKRTYDVLLKSDMQLVQDKSYGNADKAVLRQSLLTNKELPNKFYNIDFVEFSTKKVIRPDTINSNSFYIYAFNVDKMTNGSYVIEILRKLRNERTSKFFYLLYFNKKSVKRDYVINKSILELEYDFEKYGFVTTWYDDDKYTAVLIGKYIRASNTSVRFNKVRIGFLNFTAKYDDYLFQDFEFKQKKSTKIIKKIKNTYENITIIEIGTTDVTK